MKFAVCIALFATAGTLFAADDDLRKEFEAYKKDSEARIQALEQQLDQNEKTGQLTDEEVAEIRDKLARMTLDFEFDGYLRAGYGVDGQGNSMSAFKAPNAGAKYRLGNEDDVYLETTFRALNPPNPEAVNPTQFYTQIRLAYSIPGANSAAFDTTFSLREAFAAGSGVIAGNPGTAFWAGQRFYDRSDLHMNDFWYRDMSGYGGGFENMALGDFGKLAFAWIGGSIDDLQSNGQPLLDPGVQLRKDSLDLVLSEIDFLGGQLAVKLTASYFDGGTLEDNANNTLDLENSSGASATIFQDYEWGDGWKNRASFQYGTGAAFNFKGVMEAPTGLDLTGATVDPDDFNQLRLLDDLTWDAGGPITATAAAIYQRSDNGSDTGDIVQWTSLGIRPVYHFNENWSVATEAGWDYTDQSDDISGSLYKLTIAPQISPELSIYSRPVLRLFVTYAWWSDSFENQVGSATHDGETDGLSFGVQMEAWW